MIFMKFRAPKAVTDNYDKHGGRRCYGSPTLSWVGVPSCRRIPELSPSCSITYKFPIFYPLCFDIHASDRVCGGPYPPSAFRRSDNDSQIYPISFHTLPHSLPKTRSPWVHESPAYPGALGSTSHQSRITSHHLCHQSALCPTGYLSRGRASSVLLERTAPSNKLPTGHRSFFLLHGRV